MRYRNHKRMSFAMTSLLVGLGVLGLFMFSHELPAMRRYMRMRSM